jgi:hypothetical protein
MHAHTVGRGLNVTLKVCYAAALQELHTITRMQVNSSDCTMNMLRV